MEPHMENEVLSISINSVTILEVTRQTIHIPVTLHLAQNVTEKALIDSGAGGNFIDHQTVENLQLARTELRQPITVRNVDGTQNYNRQIMH